MKMKKINAEEKFEKNKNATILLVFLLVVVFGFALFTLRIATPETTAWIPPVPGNLMRAAEQVARMEEALEKRSFNAQGLRETLSKSTFPMVPLKFEIKGGDAVNKTGFSAVSVVMEGVIKFKEIPEMLTNLSDLSRPAIKITSFRLSPKINRTDTEFTNPDFDVSITTQITVRGGK